MRSPAARKDQDDTRPQIKGYTVLKGLVLVGGTSNDHLLVIRETRKDPRREVDIEALFHSTLKKNE